MTAVNTNAWKKRWTPQEEALAKDLLLRGRTYSEVADLIGRTARGVQERDIELWHVKRRQKVWLKDEAPSRKQPWTPEEEALAKDLLEEGMRYAEVAKRLGRTRKGVADRNRAVWKIAVFQKFYTPEEENTVRELMALGTPYREVARQVGRTKTAIVKKNRRDWGARNMKPRSNQFVMSEGKAFHNWSRFRGKRLRCLERDTFTCQDCGVQDFSDTILNVHHIDGNGRGKEKPNNDLSNLVTLCVSCHSIRHNRREVKSG